MEQAILNQYFNLNRVPNPTEIDEMFIKFQGKFKKTQIIVSLVN